ncbi:MAG TPA: HlyD family efflux transporter periplasmic adaptor subunit [Jatrophihabitans sp.]|nr:HlyD family efflux transporter periplasmic adaptor subunit [Jatrophihabitans sp.]
MAVRFAPGRRPLIGLVAVAVLALALVVAVQVASGSPTRYRTATVASADVSQQLVGVGSVARVNQYAAAFPVTGTVASVAVKVGSKVTAGQVLATLATQSLDQSMNQAVATLANAQQSLAADQASETAAVASATPLAGASAVATNQAMISRSSSAPIVLAALVQAQPSGTHAPPSAPAASAGTTVSQLIARITAEQRTLLADQQKLDADLTAAESALSACQLALSQPMAPTSTPVTSTPGMDSAAAASAAPADPSTVAPSPAAATPNDGNTTCLDAISSAPSKAAAAADEQARDTAEQALAADLASIEHAAQTGAGRTGSGGGSGTGSGAPSGSSHGGATIGGRPAGSITGSAGNYGTSGSASNPGGSGGAFAGSRTASGPASAQQLAADQAQIDAAQAELVVAQQNLAEATLRSPLTGTVGAVGLTAGKTASSSASITVIGDGQSEVSTTVSLNDIDSVKVGDQATVQVDGINQPLTGKVSLIGLLNSATGSTTSYPVTILLDPTGAELYDGAGASVQIQVAQAKRVLTVPTSAVHRLGQLSTVTVLSKGKPVTTRITLGAIGSDRTQVLTGLKAGQQVVLANLSEPLPTTAG